MSHTTTSRDTATVSDSSGNLGEIKVIIKYKDKKIENVEFHPRAPFRLFQERIYKLTKVLPERQKLYFKGKALKEGEEIKKLPFKENCVILLTGSTETEINELNSFTEEEQTLFVEDMTYQEKVTYAREFIQNKDDMDSSARESARLLINSLEDLVDIKYYDFTKQWSLTEYTKDLKAGSLEAEYLFTRAQRLLSAIRENEPEEAKKLAFGHYHPVCSPFALAMSPLMQSNPILAVAAMGDLPLLQFFVEEGKLSYQGRSLNPISFMRSYKTRSSPLHLAAEHGHVDLLKYLIGICTQDSIDVKDASSITPLMYTIKQENEETFDILFNGTLLFGTVSPYFEALAKTNMVNSMRKLLNIYFKMISYEHMKLLFKSAMDAQCSDMVTFFVQEAYMNVNSIKSVPSRATSRTPLQQAFHMSKIKFVQTLVSLGAPRSELDEVLDTASEENIELIEETPQIVFPLQYLLIRFLNEKNPKQLEKYLDRVGPTALCKFLVLSTEN